MPDPDLSAAARLVIDAWTMRRDSMTASPTSDDLAPQTLQQVRDMLVEAVSIYRAAGAQTELIHALRKLGHVEQDMGNREATLALYEEAVTVSRNSGDILLQAHSVRHLGDIFRDFGKTRAALEYYSEAVATYRSVDEPPALDYANALRPLALVMEKIGELPMARELWTEARELYRSLSLQEGVDECSRHLAAIGE